MFSAKFSRVSRKIHYYISWIVFVPLLVVFVTGFLLILRQQFEWIQPTKIKTGHSVIEKTWSEIYQQARHVTEAEIKQESDVSKVVLRPSRGLVEVFSKNRYHLQIDGKTGEVLNVAPRYTGLLITLHEGVFFGRWVKSWIFTPTAFFAICLWLTGFVLLFKIKRKANKSSKIKS